ncbi:MAG TPA: amidohydrolase family protein [Acidimicrobiales bacterium]|nr:amidohydrolase family protein [Acidimicrobiales bacterium]
MSTNTSTRTNTSTSTGTGTGERRYRVISADGHLETPPDGWLRHIPAEHLDRAPRLVKLRTGGEGWIVEGMPMIHNGQNVAGGRPLKVLGGSYWDDDGTPVPGTGDAAQRLREQDADGLDAEILYPPVFITRFIENVEDQDAYLAMVRAYNDWLAEDYCSVAPDRLIGNAVIPASGVDDAVAELKRASGLGLRSVCLGSFPNGTGTPADEDDRFWEAALALDMPVTAHATMGDRTHPLLVQSATGKFDLTLSMMSRTIPPPVLAMVQMVLSGVFDRIPELRVYLAETNASWMPGVLYMMDDSYRLFRHWYGVDLAKAPSEYVAEHLYFGIVRDPMALKMADLLPVERLMWGSDFPHSVTSFPNSRHWLDEMFAGTSPGLRRRILLDNPCEYWRLDPDAALTPTPA